MASFGKKILSAFVEINKDEDAVSKRAEREGAGQPSSGEAGTGEARNGGPAGGRQDKGNVGGHAHNAGAGALARDMRAGEAGSDGAGGQHRGAVQAGSGQRGIRNEVAGEASGGRAGTGQVGSGNEATAGAGSRGGSEGRADHLMEEYFDQLFREANIPGPDYFEFSKMVAALKAVPDELSRFCAAYAGLQVQGLTKERLLTTAGEYMRVLEADSARFQSTVEAALQEKVHGKKAESEEKSQRIRSLSREISELQSQITALQSEIRESEQKITGRAGDYHAESNVRKQQIAADIEKIKQYIHQR